MCKLRLLSLLLGCTVFVSSIDAAIINFDDLTAPSTFSSQTNLAEEYAGVGVHFNGPGRVLNLASNFGGAPLNEPFSSPNYLAFSGLNLTETITFDYLINAFFFDFSGATNGTISFQMFNEDQASPTFTFSMAEEYLNNGWGSVGLSAEFGLLPFNKIVATFYLYNNSGLSTFVVDNFNFTAVPIPPALWLFGSGLLGLVGMARRKKKHEC